MTKAQVLGRSMHVLIAQLYIEAMKQDRDKNNSIGGVTPWCFFDGEIPKPDEHTAPIWVFACEGNPGIKDKAYSFVPPLSTPAHRLNIPDSGTDRWLRPRMVPRLKDPYRTRFRQVDYRKMRQAGLSEATPVARVVGEQIRFSQQPRTYQDGVRHDALETLIRDRMDESVFMKTPPLLPNCPERLHSIAGSHIRAWTTHGFILRGGYSSAPMYWSPSQDSALIAEGAIKSPHVPYLTPPVWFGFTNPADLTEWCQAYVKHRAAAIRAFDDPSQAERYPDFGPDLGRIGRVSNPEYVLSPLGDLGGKQATATKRGLAAAQLSDLFGG